jgi:quercetin dioxygenase-like cupin family protein
MKKITRAATLTTVLTASLTAALTLAAPPASAADAAGLPHAFDAGWQGQKTCELLFENEAVRVGRCTFPPGIGHERHYHNPHFGYVLEGGTMRLTDAAGESDSTTEAGATWSTAEVTVHQGLNVGETTTRYLIVEPKVAGQ